MHTCLHINVIDPLIYLYFFLYILDHKKLLQTNLLLRGIQTLIINKKFQLNNLINQKA